MGLRQRRSRAQQCLPGPAAARSPRDGAAPSVARLVQPAAETTSQETTITTFEETPDEHTGHRALPAPSLRGLPAAVGEVTALSKRLADARASGYANAEGGDVAANGSSRSLVRHVANYLAAAELADHCDPPPAVIDVGGGTGLLGSWLAARRATRLHLVDSDSVVRGLADAAFPDATVHADIDELPRGSAGVVAAMEVLEHVERADQPAFLRELVRLVAPGGLLVLSTPDESGYVGGHSGYTPHVGVVDAIRLRELLTKVTDSGVHLWRLGGTAFDLPRWQRYLLPVGNRVWGRVAASAPGVVKAAGRAAGALNPGQGSRTRPSHLRAASDARAVELGDRRGTGLLAAVRIPAAASGG